MANNVEYTVIHGPEWALTIEALREVDDTLASKFKSAIRKEAGPVLNDLRRAALALPAYKARHSGLRARIAAGVGEHATTAGIRFTTSMPPGQEELPRGEDAGEKGWRHPVFGNQNNWVHQRGGSWFRSTIQDDRESFERNMADVLAEAADTIARAGHA